MTTMIPYGRQDISDADIQSVINVLRSDYLTQGPAVPAFEKSVTDYCNTQYGVAVNSATSALHIACLALEVSKGDLVWTSPNTFVASANCALYCGAKVDFVDIDAQTYNMSVEALRTKLMHAEKTGRLPKVVIPVHFAGQSCEMKDIKALANQYGFRVIEDASHAIGGRYLNEPIGNCRYADITIFSFHPVKIITTAEGGMALSNNPELAQRMALLRSHGITRDSKQMTENHGAWYYQQQDLGFNYRMTDIQAALGLSQMKRLDDFIVKRHAIAQRYTKQLSALPICTPRQHPDTFSSYHLYPIRIKNRKSVFDKLRSADIGVNVHYIPVHTQPYYQNLGFKVGDFPVAEAYYQEAISLPMYPLLTESQQQYVINTLTELVK
jgi:UDP-4-amino-4,6-dideoxy-N-acetyl-beta-L-altrosamine transaminase